MAGEWVTPLAPGRGSRDTHQFEMEEGGENFPLFHI